MLEKKPYAPSPTCDKENSFILGTLKEVQAAIPEIRNNNHKIADDGLLADKRTPRRTDSPRVIITRLKRTAGVLYGVFRVPQQNRPKRINRKNWMSFRKPYAPIRWV